MNNEKDYNPFEFVGGGKRYLTQNYALRKRFGCKVMKISLNANFSCPNIDGTKGTGGCTYCKSGSGEFAGDPQKTIAEQFFDVRKKMNEKWNEGKYIPYFQANTNTYGSAEKIRKMFDEALSLPDICAAAIATRADCISDETADILSEISEKIPLFVELGLQTIFDKTAEKINRCHTYAEFLEGYNKLKSKGLDITVHIIDGLPDETHEMMLETARTVSELSPHSIKIHLLHVLKGTALAEDYLCGKFNTLGLSEYVNIVCDQLELISPNICIERLTGDGSADDLISPLWSRKKFVVMNEIDKEMRRRGSWQGKFT